MVFVFVSQRQNVATRGLSRLRDNLRLLQYNYICHSLPLYVMYNSIYDISSMPNKWDEIQPPNLISWSSERARSDSRSQDEGEHRWRGLNLAHQSTPQIYGMVNTGSIETLNESD